MTAAERFEAAMKAILSVPPETAKAIRAKRGNGKEPDKAREPKVP